MGYLSPSIPILAHRAPWPVTMKAKLGLLEGLVYAHARSLKIVSVADPMKENVCGSASVLVGGNI